MMTLDVIPINDFVNVYLTWTFVLMPFKQLFIFLNFDLTFFEIGLSIFEYGVYAFELGIQVSEIVFYPLELKT